MITKCLFPAAGYGTRFLPATKAMPKEMLPIVNKPLIQYGVEEAMYAGMNEIAIITGRNKRAIEDHFDISYELEHEIAGTNTEKRLDSIRKLISECKFSYTRQSSIRGLGDAILTGETLIGNVPFGVILSDDLCFDSNGPGVLMKMREVFDKYKCSVVAVEEVAPEDTDKYGILSGPENADGLIVVSDMIEKPQPESAPSNLGIIGRYILTPDIFEILKEIEPGHDDELQLTDALKKQAEQGKLLGYPIQCKRFDCGNVHGFIEATNYLYEKGG